MTYDAKYDVPADAKAVVVAPSIVSDRYVQLTPVYRGGEVLADGVVLSGDRTAVPVELDQIYDSFNELNLVARPAGREQGRRAVRPARRRAPRTSRATASCSARRSRTSRRASPRSATRATSCSARWPTSPTSPTPSPRSDATVRTFNTRPRRRRLPARGRARGPRLGRRRTSRSPSARWRPSCARTRRT